MFITLFFLKARLSSLNIEVERITEVDPVTKNVNNGYLVYVFPPASGYARDMNDIHIACDNIEIELEERLNFFNI